MTQWYGPALGALGAGVLLVLYTEVRRHAGRHRRRRTRGAKPMFQVQRNGRVRFDLEDLRRSSAPAARRRPPRPDRGIAISDLEITTPDLFSHRGLRRPRPRQVEW